MGDGRTSLRQRTLSVLMCGLALAGAPAFAADSGPEAADAPFVAAESGDLAPLEAGRQSLAAPAAKALAEARLHAARFDADAAELDLRRYFTLRDADAYRQAQAWSIAEEIAFAKGDYAAAAKASGRALDYLPKDDWRRPETAQTRGLETVLSGAPPQTLAGGQPKPVPVKRDKAGLMEADVSIDGLVQSAVLDSGADISTLTASAAKRLDVRLLDGSGSVSSATRDAVPTRLGVADRVEIGGVVLEHVAFLVVDDAQLSFPGGFKIDAIIGSPVFRALGRVEFAPGARFASGAAASRPVAQSAPLRTIGEKFYVTIRVNGIDVPLHLDTGSTSSGLSAVFARSHAEWLAGLKRRRDREGGAGGFTASEVAILPAPTVALADRALHPAELTITLDDTPGSEKRNLGVLGGDLLGQFCSFVLDFRRGTLEPGASKGAAGCPATNGAF